MSSVSANGGQRMLETPVLIRTKSLEELQADEDELGVPEAEGAEGEGAPSRAPGTPEPVGRQLLPPRRRVENDENAAPAEDETHAACDVVASASLERDGDSSDAGGAHGRADLRDGEGAVPAADVAPKRRHPRSTRRGPRVVVVVAARAERGGADGPRVFRSEQGAHAEGTEGGGGDGARGGGDVREDVHTRFWRHRRSGLHQIGVPGGGREREGERGGGGGKRPREEDEEEEADATTTGKSAKKESLGRVDAAPREGVFA